MKLRALFLTEGSVNPAARFRCEQFFPHFERAGVQCLHVGSYGPGYNRYTGLLGDGYRLAGRLRRALATVTARDVDVVVLQRTALPFTAFPERWAGRHLPTIFDFDDAIYLGVGGAPSVVRERAFRSAVGAATHLVAGNRHLSARAGHPEKTTVLPTVLDTAHFVPPTKRPERARSVVGWMGTASNFVHLRPALPSVLRAIARRPGAVLRIVTNGTLPEYAGDPRVEQVQWSRENELTELQGFDVGLMPLLDSEVARGKCAFKMLQYMAVETPVLASAVGANVEVLEGSGAGTLIAPTEDWEAAVGTLLDDPAQRRAMGAKGRARAVAQYSIQAVLPTWLSLFERLTQRA